MQIQYQIPVTLSTYSESVLAGNWKFPDYSDKCPLCGSANCAVRIGFYYRWVYAFKENKLIKIPVARYLCRRKNRAKSRLKSSHKTFSLLPSSVIPYHLYDIFTLIFIVSLVLIQKMPLVDAACELSAKVEPQILLISPATVLAYLLLFKAAHTKMLSLMKHEFDTLQQFLEYLQNYSGGPVAYTEYIYHKYALFLFGTPSQSRQTSPGRK